MSEENGEYTLTHAAFDPVHTASEVRQDVQRFIRRLNLTIRLQTPERGLITEGTEFLFDGPNGTKSTQFIDLLPIDATIKVMAHTITGGGATPPQIALFDVLAALQDDPVLNAIMPLTKHDENLWAINAWKVFELIRHDVEERTAKKRNLALGPDGVGWISDDEFERFERTVNSPDVSGSDARHAVSSRNDASITPMPRSEVAPFINRLVERWVRWRHTAVT